MRKYWLYFRLSLIRTFTYRGQLLVFTLASVLSVIPMVALSLGLGNISAAGFSRDQLLTYYLVGLFFQRLIYSSLINYYVRDIISDGSIVGLFLTKPVSFFWAAFGLSFGWTAIAMIVGLLVCIGFIVVIGLGSLATITITSALITDVFLAIILAELLVFSSSLVLGLIAFWTPEISSFVSLYWLALFLFGGITLPLSFFPNSVRLFLNLNPFRFMFSFPMEILLGRINGVEIATGFVYQLIWIVVSILAFRLIWKAGNKVYTGYGQ